MALLTMNVRRGSIHAGLRVAARSLVCRRSPRVVAFVTAVRPWCDLRQVPPVVTKRSSLTGAAAGENVSLSKPGDRKVGGLRRLLAALQVDAELPEFDHRGSAPPDRVGRERQHERHSVRLAERLAVAQDAVVARRRLDREADGFEPPDEFAYVLPHRVCIRLTGSGSGGRTGAAAVLPRRPHRMKLWLASKQGRVTRGSRRCICAGPEQRPGLRLP